MRIAAYCAGILGMLLATWLIAYQGVGTVVQALTVAGWALVFIALYHLVPLLLDALAWRGLIPHKERPALGALAMARWIRESVNGLLPVGQIGGQLAAVRMLMLFGVSGSTSAASVTVDITLGITTQILFMLSGLGLLLGFSDHPAAKAVLIAALVGLSLLVSGAVSFFLAQRRGLFGLLKRLWEVSAGTQYKLPLKLVARIDGAIQELYLNRRALCTSGVWRLASWVAGVGEIWLTLYFLGHPISLTEAWILESLGQVVRTSAFIVPWALGVQEGGYILLGGFLGLDPPVSLAISLAKRIRELGLGLPGLLTWQFLEGQRFWNNRVRAPAPRPQLTSRLRLLIWALPWTLFFTACPVLHSTVAAAEANLTPASPQRTRGYFSLRYGRAFFSDNAIAPGFEIADGAGQELFAAQLGVNWGRYLGLELAADFYESGIDAVGRGKVVEYTVYEIIPQVRLRYPLLNDRLTPYVIGGLGVGFTESSDRTLLGTGPELQFGGQDTSVVYALGGGLEYFIADNIAVGVEVKYVFHDAFVEVNGAPVEADLDALLTSVGLRLFFPGPPKLAPTPTPPVRELRPYFGFWLGLADILNKQITPAFEISENESGFSHSLALGLNLNRYLGAELVANHYGRDIDATDLGKVGEYEIWSFVPQVRVRYPLMGDKLVPYLTGGVGVGLTQSNDTTPLGASGQVPRFSADDYSVVGSVGAGVEYFVADNMTVGVEAKYLFQNPQVKIEEAVTEIDLDSVLVSIGMRVFFP